MSRYADKRPRPGCRAEGCPHPAAELKIRHGILGWWCTEHLNK